MKLPTVFWVALCAAPAVTAHNLADEASLLQGAAEAQSRSGSSLQAEEMNDAARRWIAGARSLRSAFDEASSPKTSLLQRSAEEELDELEEEDIAEQKAARIASLVAAETEKARSQALKEIQKKEQARNQEKIRARKAREEALDAYALEAVGDMGSDVDLFKEENPPTAEQKAAEERQHANELKENEMSEKSEREARMQEFIYKRDRLKKLKDEELQQAKLEAKMAEQFILSPEEEAAYKKKADVGPQVIDVDWDEFEKEDLEREISLANATKSGKGPSELESAIMLKNKLKAASGQAAQVLRKQLYQVLSSVPGTGAYARAKKGALSKWDIAMLKGEKLKKEKKEKTDSLKDLIEDDIEGYSDMELWLHDFRNNVLSIEAGSLYGSPNAFRQVAEGTTRGHLTALLNDLNAMIAALVSVMADHQEPDEVHAWLKKQYLEPAASNQMETMLSRALKDAKVQDTIQAGRKNPSIKAGTDLTKLIFAAKDKFSMDPAEGQKYLAGIGDLQELLEQWDASGIEQEDEAIGVVKMKMPICSEKRMNSAERHYLRQKITKKTGLANPRAWCYNHPFMSPTSRISAVASRAIVQECLTNKDVKKSAELYNLAQQKAGFEEIDASYCFLEGHCNSRYINNPVAAKDDCDERYGTAWRQVGFKDGEEQSWWKSGALSKSDGIRNLTVSAYYGKMSCAMGSFHCDRVACQTYCKDDIIVDKYAQLRDFLELKK